MYARNGTVVTDTVRLMEITNMSDSVSGLGDCGNGAVQDPYSVAAVVSGVLLGKLGQVGATQLYSWRTNCLSAIKRLGMCSNISARTWGSVIGSIRSTVSLNSMIHTLETL